MARTPKTTEVIDINDTSIDQPKVAGAMALMQADAANTQLVLAEQKARVQAVALKLKYEGSLSPDALENGARDAIRRINLGVFELGGYLLMLREACEHGAFLSALERLELEPRVAQQYMQVTRRFANANVNSHLQELGKTKLLEMMVLDDEQIEDLIELGQTGELALDKVATMSVRELRAALREAKAEKDATDHLVETKNKTIDRLQREVKRFENLPPDEKLQALQKDVADAMNDASGAILGRMRGAMLALVNAADERHVHDVLLAGLVGQVQARLAELRDEFNLPDVSNAKDAQLAAEMAQWSK